MKLNHISIIVLIITSTFSLTSNAESCGRIVTFKEAFNYEQTVLVIHGKVMGYLYYTSQKKPPELRTDILYGQQSSPIQFEVKNVLKGVHNSNLIVVSGAGGLKARRYATSFPVGTEWIIAIGNEGGVSTCGDFALKVEGNEVITNLKGKEERINISAFYKSLGLSDLTHYPSGTR